MIEPKKTTMKGLFIFAVLLLSLLAFPSRGGAEAITSVNYRAEQIKGLQSQTTNTILEDDLGFIWISNRNGIDRYDGMHVTHYKLGGQQMRGYRDGMMILMHKDQKGRLWAFTERGRVYCYDANEDRFTTAVDLYSHQKWCSIQSLYVTEDDRLVMGVNEGIISYDLNSETIVNHVAPDCYVRSIVPYGRDSLIVGSDEGLFVYDPRRGQAKLPFLQDLSVSSLKMVGNNLWIGTRGKGLYYMQKDRVETLTFVEGSENLYVNALDYGEHYGLLVGTDGNGLLQLDLDRNQLLPKSKLLKVAYDNQDATFPTKSGGINGILTDGKHIWFSMYMGGCIHLAPSHPLVALTNPVAESPSDNFVYDLDNGPDGNLWVAYNQAIVCYDKNTFEPQVYMDHESRFLTLKVMPDSTVWAGGFGTGLYHFDPATGRKEWFSSVADLPVNDCIYDLHDSPDGDLWVGGLNFPLTRLHFLPDGTFEKTCFKDITQVFDVESLNRDTLFMASSDGIWMLDTNTGKYEHYFQVGDDKAWQGTNFVRSIVTRHGREVWMATAGAGLVCYDVEDDKYAYFDNLDVLPSLELRSVLLLNDSLLCVSTENTGIFTFNVRTHRTVRSFMLEDDLLQQEFLQNSGYRLPSGNVFFGGDQGAVRLTANDLMDGFYQYDIFVTGPAVPDSRYFIGYRHNNFYVEFCTNDVYHQEDYKFQYRVEGWSDSWLPTDGRRSLRLVNLPAGDWDLEIRAINSSKMEMNKVLHLHVNKPIWFRWYAWAAYVILFFYLVLKIVLYLLRPRIEDM